MMTIIQRSKIRPEALVEKVYQALKNDIFEFRLMPGDRFSESEIAERMEVRHTPNRQALFWLEREGYFEELYDLRKVTLHMLHQARLQLTQ